MLAELQVGTFFLILGKLVECFVQEFFHVFFIQFSSKCAAALWCRFVGYVIFAVIDAV